MSEDSLSSKKHYFICLRCHFRVPYVKLTFDKATFDYQIVGNCQCGDTFNTSLTDYMKKIEQITFTASSNENCSSQFHPPTKATSYCIDCIKNLCETCLKYHNENTNGHAVIKSKKIKLYSKCQKHNQQCDLFCLPLQKVMCKKCIEGTDDEYYTNMTLEDILENYNNTQLINKEKVLKTLDKYYNYLLTVYKNIAFTKTKTPMKDIMFEYEKATERFYYQKLFIECLYHNLEADPDNIMTLTIMSSIPDLHPLYIIKGTINGALYHKFFKRVSIFDTLNLTNKARMTFEHYKDSEMRMILCSEGTYVGGFGKSNEREGKGIIFDDIGKRVLEGEWKQNMLIASKGEKY